MEPKSEKRDDVFSFLEHFMPDARPDSEVINKTRCDEQSTPFCVHIIWVFSG